MEEYILEQLNILEAEKQANTIRLQEIARIQADLDTQLQNCTESQESDLELFSPRMAYEQDKEKITELKQQIEDAQFQEVQLRNTIEQLEIKIEKFHNLLLDARKKIEVSVPEEKSAENIISDEKAAHQDNGETETGTDKQSEEREHLEDILRKVEKCLNLIHVDKLKCKNELKNLRYYLRALIAEKDQQ